MPYNALPLFGAEAMGLGAGKENVLKIGKIGGFTLALGMVILMILGLRVLIIPHLDDQGETRSRLIGKPLKPGEIPDFSQFDDVNDKKQAFFDFLRPVVQQQNAIIAEQRRFLELVLNQYANGHMPDKAEKFRIKRIADKYDVELRTMDDKEIGRLLKRVDTIPESMVLIQAANESGWGSSRFAREGYNFFGQWCFTPGCGLVPSSRNSGQSHEVAMFKSVEASVAAYMQNLNSNAAYALFRTMRADLRAQDLEPSAEQLVYGLVNYSERQEAYIDELLDMLRHNEQYLVTANVQKVPA
jgi:Bax protein